MSYDDNFSSGNKPFKKFSKGGELADKETLDHQPIQAKPLEVKIYGDNFERAFKAFRALVQKERILAICKEKMAYEKPSQKRRRKIKERNNRLFEEECLKNNLKM